MEAVIYKFVYLHDRVPDGLLKQTLGDYIEHNKKKELTIVHHVHLMRIIHLLGQLEVISDINNITENDEINTVELNLRRYLNMFMYIPDINDEIVQNWLGRFDLDANIDVMDIVHYFKTNNLCEGIPYQDVFILLSMLMDYPRDGYINLYKFKLFIDVFGPREKCLQNVMNLIREACFHGEISRAQSERALSKNTYLIRCSRTHPKTLVVSLKNEHNRPRHVLYRDMDKLKAFLQRLQFGNYVSVPNRKYIAANLGI